MSLFLVLAVALVPGLVSWWSGRGLLAKRDDPALAERLLARNRRLFLLTLIVLVGVGFALAFEENKLLAGPIALMPVFGMVAGGFPLRRGLYEETWSFAAYLVFMLRLLVGVGGFWLLLLSTPYLVWSSGEERRWLAAAALGLLLTLWNRGYARVLIRLAGARPLDADGERFGPYFAAVDERSSVPPPERYLAPVPGGRLVNAVALPSARRSRVVFTSSLVELLEPDEVGAIYAHEVGHLEYFRGRRLRYFGIVSHLLTAVAVTWSLFPWGDAFLQAYLWPLLFLVLVRWRNHWMRGHETDTDVRATELCGDADALIRGLVRLHQLMILPRRLAVETEKAMSHPSLARRIQAIRESAGLEAEGARVQGGSEGEAPASSPAEAGEALPPLFLRTGRPGVCLLLESERLTWFEGVPADLGEEAPTFDALHRSAASSRTLVYGQLVEARLEFRRAGASLVVVDRRGKKRRFAVANDDVGPVQRRLDAVDARLAAPAGEAASTAARPWHRLLATAAALSSVLPPVAGAVSVPALFALVRPEPASLAATGLAGLAAGAYRAFQIPAHSFDPAFTQLNTLLLVLVSLPLLISGIRGSRQAPEARSRSAPALAATCWVLTAVHWGVLFYLSAGGGALDVFRLSWLLYWAPSAFLLPLSAAAALFFGRRGGRPLLVLAAALAMVPLAATTTAFRDANVRDPLVPRSPVPPGGSPDLMEVARAELDIPVSELRLSPSGETWAICDGPGWGFCESGTWRLGKVDGSPVPAGAEEALSGVVDLAFLDDERLVVLRRRSVAEGSSGDEGPARGHLVVRQDLGGGGGPPIELPFVPDYESSLSAGGEAWRVVAHSYQGERHLLRRITGSWSSDEIEETVWELSQVEAGWDRGAAGGDEHALVVRSRFDFENSSYLGSRTRQELLALTPASDERSLVSTRLDVTCEILPPFDKGLCIARDRGRSHLWWIDPAGGEPEAAGTYRSADGEELLATEVGVLIRTPFGPGYWLEPPGGRLFELAWPAEGGNGVIAVSRTGLVAELREDVGRQAGRQGGSLLVLYRVRP